MNHTEFASAIKAKYPQYADMSDADLTRAMMAKFPEYSDVDTSGMVAKAPKQNYGTNAYIPPKLRMLTAIPQAAPEAGRGLFSAARDVVAAPLAIGEAGARMLAERVIPKRWLPELQRGMTANPDEYTQGRPASFRQALETAWNGRKEGLRGIGDNPLNVAALIPELAPARLAEATASLAPAGLGIRTAAMSPWGQMGLESAIGAAQGSGLAGIDATMNPQAQRDAVPAMKWGGLAGGLGQALSGGLQKYGASKFPGLSEAKNLKVTPEAKSLVRANLDEVLSPGILPKGKEGFLKLSESKRQKLGEAYDAATAAVPPDWTVPTQDIWSSAEDRLRNELGRPGGYGLDLQPGSRTPVLPQSAQDMMDQSVRKIMANQIHAGAPEDVLTASQLAGHRPTVVNPKTYMDPAQNTPSMLQKNVGEAWHGAITDALMGAPNYAATLGTETPRQYALWKSVNQLTATPGNLELAHRLGPLNLAVSHWMLPSALYKAGQATAKGSMLGAYLANPGLFQGAQATDDSLQTQGMRP